MDGHVFFNQDNVWVTELSFVNGVTSYPIASIQHAAVVSNPQLDWVSLALLGLGLLSFAWSPLVGLLITALTLLVMWRQRSFHYLELSVEGDPVRALKSSNHAYLGKILSAIELAMLERDGADTVPLHLLD